MAKRKKRRPQKKSDIQQTFWAKSWVGLLGLAVVGIVIWLIWRPGQSAATPPVAELTPVAAASTATSTPASATQIATPTSPPAGEPTMTPVAGPALDSSPMATPTSPDRDTAQITEYTYQIVNVYPHDPEAFTQGLVFYDGIFYEGTGLRGRSRLRKVTIEEGAVLQEHRLSDELFGEGITLFGDSLIQLTWQSRRGFVYDRETFTQQREFSYPTEGWGITYDGSHLIMSDGTPTLYFWDPQTLEEIGQVEVHDDTGPVTALNELEFINGEIYANVWKTDRIARIDPETGAVTGWINLAGLLTPEERANTDVLNGIAYDPETDRLFVTGKWWPKLFEIDLVPLE